ncbi:fimbrial protein [uncultured Bacteroides sp.]|uniref:fimbrial protein n=1 Tax=uncultured Bacteroides sp. TaxID=162156 RepID=UPI0025ADCACD|nr:fimbrial protein [uncultured Bacteroides sp.]
MKVKKILLSMCAIAALASCSQNDDVAVPTDSAPPAKVTIRFAGSEGMTRAIGSDDAVVNNLTAFFFNTAGALIKTPMPVAENDLKPKITLATTTDASQVVLVANVPAGTKFDAVTSLSKLKEFVVSSLGTEASGNFPINQTKTNLTMSGWGAINMNADDNTGTANVKLHFMAAKIETLKVTIGGKNVGHYADTEDGVTDDKWFTIKQAYLMMAQTNSVLLPATDLGAWTGAFTPATFAYAGGLAWGTRPWENPPVNPDPVKATDYLQTTIPAGATSNVIDNILVSAPWYVFENASPNATGVVLEVVCNVRKDNNTLEKESRYFTMYFGEKKTGDSGNQPILNAGQRYSINIALNGSFDPGDGTGGGGTTDPTKPSVDANVEITVAPAEWTAVAVINKEFN